LTVQAKYFIKKELTTELTEKTVYSSYPFGMPMPNRTYSLSSTKYRFGFNGKEKDNEVYGEGNAYSFEARTFDSRIGRWFSTDPREGDYAWQTPYAYHRNNPINSIDYMGMGDPPGTTTAYHNTSVADGASIINDGTFKAGQSGWNYFMTDASGSKAGSEVAKAPVQFEVTVNMSNAHEISYKQWNGFFNEAKAQLGLSEVANADLSKDQLKQVNKIRNIKAVNYMNSIEGANAFIINAEKGASGQKFYALKNEAVASRVSRAFELTRGGSQVSQYLSTMSRLSTWASFGRAALRLTGEALIMEGLLYAIPEYNKAQENYNRNKLSYKEYNKKYNTNYTESQYKSLVNMGESGY
jgi:RHS repeat-associated protein